MESFVRTVFGAKLQTALLLGIPHVVDQYTTINEKLGILSATAIATSDRPKLGYVTIGNGGHRIVTGGDGVSRPDPIQHKSHDAALYNQLPFVLRAVGDDLPAVDRAKYALRKLVTYGGNSYIAYYGKRIDVTATTVAMEYNAVSAGTTVTSIYTPTSANLNPVAPAAGGGVTPTGDYLSATARVPFALDATDTEEFLSAVEIIYGDRNYGIISEVGLCSGVDKVINTEAGYTFNDVIGCQLTTIINTFFPLTFSNAGIEVEIDVGATEPLWLLA